jgi:hypothetical protein
MIRRWSSLININNNFSKFKYFSLKHKINLFKNSVNFKRFTFKISKFKRKAFIRLKHRTNFILYTNVIKFWIKDYLFNKHYLKYQFYNKIFLNNFFFYNFNFVKNRNENYFYNFNFYFSTLTNKTYLYFYNKSTFNKNSPLTLAWFINNPFLNKSILPIYNVWGDNYFKHEFIINLNFNINLLFDNVFDLILYKNLEFRKIFIYLFYNNINKQKFLKS